MANSPKHKRIESITIVIPEYKVKLESLKSRIINLLNVFSFLTLKSVNDTNSNNRDIQEKNINKKILILKKMKFIR